MKGSIRPRDTDVWQITIGLGRDPNGKRLRKYETYRGKKRDAEVRKRELLSQFDKGLLTNQKDLTFSEWAETWLEDHIRPSRRQKTTERYSDVLRKHVVPKIGHISLQKLRPSDIKKLESGWLNGGMSNQGVVYGHRVLSACLKYGVRMEMIYRNPADVIVPPKVES